MRHVSKELFGSSPFDPDNADHQNNLGMETLATDPQAAIVHFREALRLKPDDPWFLTNLGIAQRRAGMPAEAKKTLERALARQPNDVAAHNSLANVLVDLQQSGAAIGEYLRALELDPLSSAPAGGLLSLLRNMTADFGGDAESPPPELREFGAVATQEFGEAVDAGYGANNDNLGALFGGWVVRKMKGSKLPPHDLPALSRMTCWVLLLQSIQEQAAES